MRFLALLIVCWAATACCAIAEDAIGEITENERLFVRRVSTLLVEKCSGCHGADPEDINGGLDLGNLAAALQGGDSEQPSIVSGNAEESPIYLASTRDSADWSAMPPKESEALTDEQLGWLKQWIDGGAQWPDEQRSQAIAKTYSDQWSVEDGVTVRTAGGLADSWTNRRYDPRGLWAYQPIRKATFRDDEAAQHPIDALLARKRPREQDAGGDTVELAVAPPASRQELIRRVTFDLIGLPPTPEQVRAFVEDPRDLHEAFDEVVDRLLASDHYGERMAQHWLDVVRYADSSGFANDYERGNAWRYRDYVIRAFNEDKPFDQFVREQIAGDELEPNNPAAVIATGFLRMGPWELTGMEVAKVARQRFLDDVTNSVGETFLGHSLQCARCHDHKFDPVPTQDYYAVQAVFATTQLAERATPFLDCENTDGFAEQQYLHDRQREYERTLDSLNEVMLANALQWYADRNQSPESWLEAVEFVSKQNGKPPSFNAVRNRMAKMGVAAEDYPPKLVGFEPEQFGLERVARKGIERLRWQFDRYRPFALAVYNGKTPQVKSVNAPVRVPKDPMKAGELENTCILSGGDPFSPADPVLPGGLSVLGDQIDLEFPDAVEGRRTALANWIAHPDNPLTPRVIGNRIWQWHFGKAIAGNPNNFGSTGKRPTHPELLDWLAATLIENDWSIKSMHRLILSSRAYQQSTRHPNPERLARLDPLGQSYSVFQRRRLTAEELRDAMLAASGELNLEMGGIPCRPIINQEVALQPRMVMGTFAAAWQPNPLPEDRNRRSIYTLKLRGLADPFLEVFNSPPPDFSCEAREASTVTPQVFALFNGQNSLSRARSLAIAAIDSTNGDQAALIECYRRLFGREPEAEELKLCLQHWTQLESLLGDEVAVVAMPEKVVREAVEENTGERFSFEETLYASADFVPDQDPSQLTRHVRALADVCLVLINSNEFVYVD
jgi:mono/diheme cytochrome c family protein